MDPVGFTAVAHFSDDSASPDTVPFFDVKFGIVGVKGGKPVAMADDNCPAIAFFNA